MLHFEKGKTKKALTGKGTLLTLQKGVESNPPFREGGRFILIRGEIDRLSENERRKIISFLLVGAKKEQHHQTSKNLLVAAKGNEVDERRQSLTSTIT